MRFFLKEFFEPMAYLIYALVLLSLTVRSRKWKYKMLALYYTMVTALITIATVVNINNGDNNHLYNVTYLLTNFVIAKFFYNLLQVQLKRRFVLISCIINAIIFFSILAFKHSFTSIFNTHTNGAIFLTIVIYCFLYFHDLFLNIKEEYLLHSFDFWLVCSYFFYFLSAFCIIIYYETTDPNKRAGLWIMHSCILFISSLVALKGRFAASKTILM